MFMFPIWLSFILAFSCHGLVGLEKIAQNGSLACISLFPCVSMMACSLLVMSFLFFTPIFLLHRLPNIEYSCMEIEVIPLCFKRIFACFQCPDFSNCWFSVLLIPNTNIWAPESINLVCN